MRFRRNSSKKRIPPPDSYQQKITPDAASRGMRFEPTRNSHAPLWDNHSQSKMGHRPMTAHESYRLTRKPVPDYYQMLNVERVRKTQTVPKLEVKADPTRAGIRTKSADTKRSIKKRVDPPITEIHQQKTSVKIIPELKYLSDPIAQDYERYQSLPKKQSVRTFKAQPTHEDISHLHKAGSRPNAPHLTQPQKQATPLVGGGFFPETAKPGVKYHTTQRPADHWDVFQYKFAGNISSPNTMNDRKHEKKQHESTLRSSIQKDHAATKAEYMYLRSRKDQKSLALTDFSYPDNIKEQRHQQ
mmetsp:Transcript_85/g.310  ORF Transcript_85/g.310 Transcript_85/m.310 type:complete len:300 (-) Transcript_85:79-978(-)